jgi:hypothetical protein
MEKNRLLFSLMVIEAKFSRDDHGSIAATAIRRRMKPLDVKTDPRTKFNRGKRQKKNYRKRK